MERERLDTQVLERTFQQIKKITGLTNIKNIVEKVTNKDKDYNLCVAKVTEREAQLSEIKEKIRKLERDVVDLKNSASYDMSEVKKLGKNEFQDKEANELDGQEKKLKEELDEMREKYENVELIYEKVMENMKNFVKYKHEEENFLEVSRSNRSFNQEDEILGQYEAFLTKTNNLAHSTYAKVTF